MYFFLKIIQPPLIIYLGLEVIVFIIMDMCCLFIAGPMGLVLACSCCGAQLFCFNIVWKILSINIYMQPYGYSKYHFIQSNYPILHCDSSTLLFRSFNFGGWPTLLFQDPSYVCLFQFVLLCCWCFGPISESYYKTLS